MSDEVRLTAASALWQVGVPVELSVESQIRDLVNGRLYIEYQAVSRGWTDISADDTFDGESPSEYNGQAQSAVIPVTANEVGSYDLRARVHDENRDLDFFSNTVAIRVVSTGPGSTG